MSNCWSKRNMMMMVLSTKWTVNISIAHDQHQQSIIECDTGPLLLCSPMITDQSQSECHTDHISHWSSMLKHKIRKSRKNILSFLDNSQEAEGNQNFPEYSEIKKLPRKEKKKKGIFF